MGKGYEWEINTGMIYREGPAKVWKFLWWKLWGINFSEPGQSLEMNNPVNGWKNDESKLCMMCEKVVDEMVEHLMLECKGTSLQELKCW